MKRISAMLLCIAMCLSLMLTSANAAKDYSKFPQKFSDMPQSHWAFKYIAELSDKSIINGYKDGSFKPDNTVLRCEWAKMLSVASGNKIGLYFHDDTTFAVDYSKSDWYYQYVNAIAQYINFYDINGKIYFLPNEAASREDVTVSLVLLKGYDVAQAKLSYIAPFKDKNSITESLKPYIAIAVEKNLITGFEDGTFRAQDTLTRAEAAALLCRAFQKKEVTTENKVLLQTEPQKTETQKQPEKEESKTEIPKKEEKVEKEPVKTETKQEPEEEEIKWEEPEEEKIEREEPEKEIEEEEPEEEENQEEIAKNYLYIDTLAKTKLHNARCITQYNDKIYWIDEKYVFYELDTDTLKVSKISDLKEHEFSWGENTWTIETVSNYSTKAGDSLCYNEANDSLLFSTYITRQDPTSAYPYYRYGILDLSDMTVVPTSDKSWHWSYSLIKMTSDESLFYETNYSLYKAEKDDEGIYQTEMNTNVTGNKVRAVFERYPVFIEKDDALYYVESLRGLHRYDYNDTELVIEFDIYPCMAMSEDDIWLINYKTAMMYNYDYDGNIIESFSLKDVKVKDKTEFNVNNISTMFYKTDNGFVYYDTQKNAIRIIEK